MWQFSQEVREVAGVETLTPKRQHARLQAWAGSGHSGAQGVELVWRAGKRALAGCVSAAGCLMDSGGDTLCSHPPLLPITWELAACLLMWFVLGGLRNGSYSVAFYEEEYVI